MSQAVASSIQQKISGWRTVGSVDAFTAFEDPNLCTPADGSFKNQSFCYNGQFQLILLMYILLIPPVNNKLLYISWSLLFIFSSIQGMEKKLSYCFLFLFFSSWCSWPNQI